MIHAREPLSRRRVPCAARPGGFTLVEVLIASIILALGTLGLLVLFAGAATQQRLASETTQSLLTARSAGAILADRFESIGADDEAVLDQINNDVWIPVPARSAPGLDEDGLLSVEPLFFGLTEPGRSFLYTIPFDATNEELKGAGSFNGPNNNPIVCSTNRAVFFFNQGGRPGSLRALRHRRIIDESVNLVFVETDDAEGIQDDQRRGPRRIAYRRVQPGSPIAFDLDTSFFRGWNRNAPGANGIHLYTRSGDAANELSTLRDYIVLDLNSEETTDDASNEPARILGFRINDAELPCNTSPQDATRIIRSIYVDDYAYKTSDVISRSDRLITTSAGLPRLSYSLLYRGRGEGGAELGVFTFAIRGAEPGQEFLPDESSSGENPNPEAPLQRFELTLGYDEDLEQFFFALNERSEFTFALQVGSVILAADLPSDPDINGADNTVRVIGTRSVGTTIRGYLDQPPRSGGRPMLQDLDQTVRLPVFAIQTQITDSQGTRWQLEPRELQVIPINPR